MFCLPLFIVKYGRWVAEPRHKFHIIVLSNYTIEHGWLAKGGAKGPEIEAIRSRFNEINLWPCFPNVPYTPFQMASDEISNFATSRKTPSEVLR